MVTNEGCVLCGEKQSSLVYEGPIRNGSPGHQTKENHQVIKCAGCGTIRLAEVLCDFDYYQSEEYREQYNGDITAEKYLETHLVEQTPRIAKIGLERFADKTVVDYGCGGGAFLDSVKGVAKATYGIEPFTNFHPSLKARGHQVFECVEDAIRELKGQVDIIISFGVIEHAENALDYISKGKELLRPNGRMFLETDNVDDVLMHCGIPEFETFFYRTAHQWYFSKETLSHLVNKAGLEIVEVSFRQNFDVSNAMLWMRDRVPTGCGKLSVFDDRLNLAWKQAIEQAGMGDIIYMELKA